MDRQENAAEYQAECADQKQYVPVSSQAAPVPEQQYACADERQKRRKFAERSKELPEAALFSGVQKA